MTLMIDADDNALFNAVHDGRKFAIHYEYSGYNHNNASLRSHKFWCIERPRRGAPIQIRFGKIGTCGQTRNKGISVYDALERARSKEAKGYYKIFTRVAKPPAAAPKPPAALPPLSEWAATMPAPDNNHAHLDSDGIATDRTGRQVCQMAVEDANRIRAQYDLCA